MSDSSSYANVMRRVLTDPEFRNNLKRDPHGTLRDHGIHVPGDVTVHVHEADAQTAHIILPTLPAGTAAPNLSDADLRAVSGGGTIWTCQAASCASTCSSTC